MSPGINYGLGKAIINACFSIRLKNDFLKGNIYGIYKGHTETIKVSPLYNDLDEW